MLVLLFVDGAIFGLAIKKGFVSIILIVLGLIIASIVGLTIPFINGSSIASFVTGFILSEITRIGPLFLSFPILWIIGLLVGIWKG
jgi:hypothetical protein